MMDVPVMSRLVKVKMQALMVKKSLVWIRRDKHPVIAPPVAVNGPVIEPGLPADDDLQTVAADVKAMKGFARIFCA